MVTWSELQSWDASSLKPVISALGNAKDRLLAQADEAEDSVIPANWSGTAAVAAATKLQRVGDMAELVAAELTATRRAVTEAADAITGLVRGVDEARELAPVTACLPQSGTPLIVRCCKTKKSAYETSP